MKNYLLLLLLFSLSAVSQTLNQYKYVIVPVRFDGFEENQYRLNTITKKKLNDSGFAAFYEYEAVPDGIDKDRCNFLYVNVINLSGMLSSKVKVVFKDCQNKVVYESEPATSRLKNYAASYQEALNKTFETVHYKYEPGADIVTTAQKEIRQEVQAVPKQAPASVPVTGKLKAEGVATGYLLINESTSKIEIRLSKTSNPQVFIAVRNPIQGVLLQKNNEWYFEYYQNEKLVSEKIDVTL